MWATMLKLSIVNRLRNTWTKFHFLSLISATVAIPQKGRSQRCLSVEILGISKTTANGKKLIRTLSNFSWSIVGRTCLNRFRFWRYTLYVDSEASSRILQMFWQNEYTVLLQCRRSKLLKQLNVVPHITISNFLKIFSFNINLAVITKKCIIRNKKFTFLLLFLFSKSTTKNSLRCVKKAHREHKILCLNFNKVTFSFDK